MGICVYMYIYTHIYIYIFKGLTPVRLPPFRNRTGRKAAHGQREVFSSGKLHQVQLTPLLRDVQTITMQNLV